MLKNKMRADIEVIEYTASSTSCPGAVWVLTSGSTDWSENAVSIATNPSGQTAIGLNKWYVQELDTDQLLNTFRGDQQKGHPITLITKGEVTTDLIVGTPSAGDTAYLAGTGYIGTNAAVSSFGTPGTDVPQVGRFLSAKDSDGYATVQIDL